MIDGCPCTSASELHPFQTQDGEESRPLIRRLQIDFLETVNTLFSDRIPGLGLLVRLSPVNFWWDVGLANVGYVTTCAQWVVPVAMKHIRGLEVRHEKNTRALARDAETTADPL